MSQTKVTANLIATGAVPDEITKSSSDPTASTNPAGGVGTVYLNTTSGEMFCLTDATAGSNVWVNVGEGAGNILPPMTATGGTESTYTSGSVDYKVHTFTSSGTFAVSGSTATVDYLVVAGGAGASSYHMCGGGGAGGMRSAVGFSVPVNSYTITVGAGGVGGVFPASGSDGVSSIFSSITSTGGGGGSSNASAGRSGGSGGGGTGGASGGAASPVTSPVQGYAGGT